MDREKKKEYPWETLDTTTIIVPIELLTYHTFKYIEDKSMTTPKQKEKDLEIVSFYYRREKMKELEVEKCFQMR